MDNDQLVSLTGLKTSYDYRELSNLPDNSLSSYASKTRQKFSEIAKSFNDEENAEQGNRLNKLLTNCDFSESTVVNVADFGDFTWPIRQKSPSHPNF